MRQPLEAPGSSTNALTPAISSHSGMLPACLRRMNPHEYLCNAVVCCLSAARRQDVSFSSQECDWSCHGCHDTYDPQSVPLVSSQEPEWLRSASIAMWPTRVDFKLWFSHLLAAELACTYPAFCSSHNLQTRH